MRCAVVIPSGARNLTTEAHATRLFAYFVTKEGSFAPLRMTAFHIDLKFVRAVRAEDEFELKKERIFIATGQEEVLLQKVVIVLQSDF